LERVDFVARVVRELDRNGWPNRSDIGWSEFDVEIFGKRWSTVQLITVAEDHPRGRQLLRCRLRARWSLHAHVMFWLLVAADTIVAGLFGHALLWAALLLVTLPLFACFLHRQKRKLQSLVVVFLDELAKELQLIKVPAPQPVTPAVVAPEPKPAPIRVELPKPTPEETTAPEKEVTAG
jgi:hypothetical protein